MTDLARRTARKAIVQAAVRVRRQRSRIPSAVWDQRMATLAATLEDRAAGATDPAADLSVVRGRLQDADLRTVWLALAVLSATLPVPEEVSDAHRGLQTFGPDAVLRAAREASTPASMDRRVVVVTDRTLVDMGDLVLYPLGTGIQRVARMVGRCWSATHDYTAVGWTTEMDAMVPLDGAARRRALGVSAEPAPHGAGQPATVVVPWRCSYVLPELAIQPRRCLALNALARFSGSPCAVVGFDCVPLTSPETTADGFPAVFALNLAAVAFFGLVVTISGAAAVEYLGWRRMLGGAGLSGPRIVPLSLPVSVPETTPADLAAARERFLVGDLPLVLCVGSHEPRKNHLAVLHAAERLWRAGTLFSLTFVGGASWGSEEFTALVTELRDEGRPVEVVSRLDDTSLWAAYRLARLTVFPSLNEGFGLPVAESIAAGTPVVTSNFGSMREIAAAGGALLVNPREDDEVLEGMRALLEDDRLHSDLVDACGRRFLGTWEDYAERLWDLVHDSASWRGAEPAPAGSREA